MPPSLQLTSVHLRVSDLARSMDFYARQVGLVVTTRTPQRAELGTPGAEPAREPLLVLSEDRTAPAPSPAAAGLFHAALLLPTRAALGRWLRFAEHNGVAFTGFSDHGVSEAIYFSDPDGNGLEFYADRALENWPRENGELAMTTLPLDLPALLSAGDTSAPGRPTLQGAVWGHFHFRVTNLDRSEKFYSETLGVSLTQRYGSSARFLGADGYHHHIGLNTWGHPHEPHSPASLGLVEVSFSRAGTGRSETRHDPDEIVLRIADAF